MDKPTLYEICIQGYLADRWSSWFDGLTIHHNPDGNTVLCGILPDQAALHGVLQKIRDLNLVLISLRQKDATPPETNNHLLLPGGESA